MPDYDKGENHGHEPCRIRPGFKFFYFLRGYLPLGWLHSIQEASPDLLIKWGKFYMP